MTYKVEVTNGMQMYIAYEGRSRNKAADVATTAGRVLAIGRGTGDVTLRHNTVADIIWLVDNGEIFVALVGGVETLISQGGKAIES
jgi:hypothetical protein